MNPKSNISFQPFQHSSKTTYVLLPLPEARLLGLDLLREPFPERLLLLLELGVLELARLLLAELARLHLRLAVVLVVEVLRRRDEVQHVRADEERAQLAEVAVVLVLDLGHTPEVLTTLDNAAVGRRHVLRRTDDGEGHRVREDARVLGADLVVRLDGRLVDPDTLGLDNLANLRE